MKEVAACAIIFAVALIVGTVSVQGIWSSIDRDNNAFAKDCNDRGGVAHFGFDARQCIGAKEKQGESK